jgi:hypothetical protein
MPNGLTIGEQILRFAYNFENFKLYELVYCEFKASGMILDNNVIEKIANKCFCSEFAASQIIQNLIKIDPFQVITNEFDLQANAKQSVLLDCLFNNAAMFHELYYHKFLSAEGDLYQLTLAERALAQACLTKNSYFFERICYKFLKEGILIDVQKITYFFNNPEHLENTQVLVDNSKWIRHNLRQFNNSALKEELQKNNIDQSISSRTILTLLSQGADVQMPYGIGNGLSLGEQTLVKAYLTNNTELLKAIYTMGMFIDVPKIAHNWSNPNQANNLQIICKVANWFNYTIRLLNTQAIKDELQKNQAAHFPAIITLLYLGADLEADSGLGNKLNIGEHLIVHAYLNNCPTLLEALHRTGFIFDIPKIFNTLGHQNLPNEDQIRIRATSWITINLIHFNTLAIKNEFQKNNYNLLVNPYLIMALISRGVDLYQPCGLGNGLNIGEQVIAHACILNNAQLLKVIHQLDFPINVQKIAESLSNLKCPNAQAVQSTTRWITQNLSHLHTNAMLVPPSDASLNVETRLKKIPDDASSLTQEGTKIVAGF